MEASEAYLCYRFMLDDGVIDIVIHSATPHTRV